MSAKNINKSDYLDQVIKSSTSLNDVFNVLQAKEHGVIVQCDEPNNIGFLPELLKICKENDYKYSNEQIAILFNGLVELVDVSKYANPAFSVGQMKEIFYGLCNNIDITEYCDNTDSLATFEVIGHALMNGVTEKEKIMYIIHFCKSNNHYTANLVRYCFEKGFKISDVKNKSDEELKRLIKKK